MISIDLENFPALVPGKNGRKIRAALGCARLSVENHTFSKLVQDRIDTLNNSVGIAMNLRIETSLIMMFICRACNPVEANGA